MPRKKVTVRTDNSEWKAPKRRKPRKPMTKGATRGIKTFRESKSSNEPAKNPDYGKSGIHESLRSLPDDYGLSPKKC